MMVHTYPLYDLHEHITYGEERCPCMPRVEDWGEHTHLIHRSWDGREWLERAMQYASLARN